MANWKAWAQLVRVPNTLTACADVLAGFSIAVGPWTSHTEYFPGLAVLSVGAIAFYWAGMVLNDVNDIEQDKANRRRGPLVDGRIEPRVARVVGWILLAAGVLSSSLAVLVTKSWVTPEAYGTEHFVVPMVIGILLGLCIVVYDSPAKGTILGPWLMGACRGLNLGSGIGLGYVLLGMPSGFAESYGAALWLLPLGHALFVVGLTLAARKESKLGQSRFQLAFSWGLSCVGIAAIAIAPRFVEPVHYMRLDSDRWFPMLVGLLCLPWFLRAVTSVRIGSASTLVPAIKQAILTILFLDAAIALQFSGNAAGLFVCSLAIPTFLLSRYFRMT